MNFIISLIRIIYKLVFIVVSISTFAILSLIINLVIWSPFRKRVFITFLTSLTSKSILYVLNFKVIRKGPIPKEGSLVIGNHMSYLDILIYLSHFKTLFVTSTDMRSRPFLGQITLLGGCLYVNRQNPKNLVKELKNIKRFFDKGFSVTIFPEGTSSNGERVLPFKKSLFQIALQTKCQIQPVVLHYSKIDGKDFGDENRDKVCWHGDLLFFPHLINLLKLRSVEATMNILEPIDSNNFEDRKSLCDTTFETVSNSYDQLLKDQAL